MTRYQLGRRAQPDLFAGAEPDLLAPPPVQKADPDQVRARLEAILAQARADEPWSRARLRLTRTIVPQMTLWLPDEEAARWRRDIEAALRGQEDAVG